MPATPPAWGAVVLRAFEPGDIDMVMDLATDPSVPLTESLPSHATASEALAYIERQQSRAEAGIGYSFCIAEAGSGAGLGQVELWPTPEAPDRATAGYAVAPRARGRGIAAQALTAVTEFGWTIPGLRRIELYIEPANLASIRTAETAGCVREGLVRSHRQLSDREADMLRYVAAR